MDKLKTYIDKYRSQFDAEEPAAGHLERLEAKLAALQQRTANRRIVRRWYLYAAAASALLLLSLGINWLFPEKHTENQSIEICDDPATMKYCYLTRMQDTAALIDKLTENADPFVRQAVQMEVASIIEDNRSFDKELPLELPPERAQAILANYYQHHLETLQYIVQTLSANNSITTKI
jgi:hypothetical protein